MSLAELIGIGITIGSLQAKLVDCSRNKDDLFRVKAAKMREIGQKISQYDRKIHERRNQIENQLDAQLREAVTTLA